MAAQETGKQRAARIPLDYFKHPDLLQRGKTWLTIWAVLLTAGWWALGQLGGDQGRLRYSRGPVAAVHAMWDAECSACHVPFTPISGENALAPVLGKNASDQQCQTCHAGPVHHHKQADSPRCASCHREHRGREASLVHLPDSDCTRCHQDLTFHLKAGQTTTFRPHVTRFDQIHHPEFKAVRAPARDPGKLKFSHARHMAPGMHLQGGEALFKLADIRAEVDRNRYRREGQKDIDPVQLDCASCHQLDSEDFRVDRLQGLPAALLPKRNAGAYMLLITYENQCRACHPLTVEKGVEVPHRLQPDDVRVFLANTFTARYLSDHPKILERFVPSRPLPGKIVGAEEETARKQIARQVEDAERKLYLNAKTCGRCHHYEGQPGAVAPKRIIVPNVPDIWFQHAVFNHAAHRAVDCRACHAGGYTSKVAEDVLVPGIDNCLQCHAPAGRSAGQVRGGARFDCTECHRYHNGDLPAQGIGAASRAPREKRDIPAFRLGAR